MPRRKLAFTPRGLYHIYNRSIDKRTIFADEKDFHFFIGRMFALAEECGISIHAWAVMSTHYHILVQQDGLEKNETGTDKTETGTGIDGQKREPEYTDKTELQPVSKFMHRLGLTYAMYFNRKNKRKGPLFESRFQAVGVYSQDSFNRVVRYIENNAVNHKIVEKITDWEYTSLMMAMPKAEYPKDLPPYDFILVSDWRNTS